jgi:hypothetical protein
MEAPDDGKHPLKVTVFWQQMGGTGGHRFDPCPFVIQHGEHDNFGARVLGGNYAGGFDAIHVWQSHINQENVRFVLLNHFGCGKPVSGFGDNRQVGLSLQDHAKRLSEDRVVISERNAYLVH